MKPSCYSPCQCVDVLVLSEHNSNRTLAGVAVLDLCHLLAGNHPNCPVPETNLLQERKGTISLPSVQLQWERGFIFWKWRTPTNQSKNPKASTLLLISMIPLLLALYFCSFLPRILQFYQQEWSERMETREKISIGSSCHCEEGITIVFYQVFNSLVCWG